MIVLMLVFLVLFDQFLVPIMILVILCYLTEDSSKVATGNDQDRVFGKRKVLGSDHPLKKSLNITNAIEFAKKVHPFFNHNTFPCPRSSQLESDGLKLGGGAM